MAFKKGIERVNEAAQRGGNFTGGKARFFNWEAGETKTIRFLTDGDDLILTNLHEWVTCEDGKKRSFVCRREINEECELCENPETSKRREIAFALAVWREERKKDGKTSFGTKTDEVEKEEDGKTVTKVEPWVGVIRQAPKNFWGWFYEAYDKRGTLLDRDYSITRRGKKTETTYQPYPEDAQELDISKFEEFKPNLEELLERQASRDYYDKFLHGIDSNNNGSKSEKDDSSEDNSNLTKEDLEALHKANEEVVAVAGSYD